MFNNRFFLTNNLKRWMTWVEMNQPEKSTGKSLLRSRRSFLYSVPRASTDRMRACKDFIQIPESRQLHPLFRYHGETICYRFTLQLFHQKHKRFSRFFFRAKFLFLVIWNSYIAHNQLQKKGLTLRISKTK